MAGITATGAATVSRDAQILKASYIQSNSIDYMTTGGDKSDAPKGILRHIDACDADCQAERLGLSFDE